MDRGVQIRQAVKADYAAVRDLYAEADALHADAVSDLFRHTKAPARTRSLFDGFLADPAMLLLVAESSGTAIGLVRAVERRRDDIPDVPALRPRRFVAVEELVVAASARRRGIGTALMERAEAWALERGMDVVELTVYDFNTAARALYDKLGYETRHQQLAKRLG